MIMNQIKFILIWSQFLSFSSNPLPTCNKDEYYNFIFKVKWYVLYFLIIYSNIFSKLIHIEQYCSIYCLKARIKF